MCSRSEPSLSASASVVPAGAGKQKRRGVGVVEAGVDHLRDEDGMVAAMHGVGDASFEPGGKVEEKRSPRHRPGLEGESAQAVSFDGNRAKEFLGDLLLAVRQEVHREGSCSLDG